MKDEQFKQELQSAVNHRLSGLQADPWMCQRVLRAAEGEKKIVKKKLSVSLVVVLLVMLLTASVGVALVHSDIANRIFGGDETVPETVLEAIHQTEEKDISPYGTLKLDEWLYNGDALHTSISVSNETDEPLLYTMDGIWLNDCRLTFDRTNSEGAWDSGFLLGGQVDGKDLPHCASIYNYGKEVYRLDKQGDFEGFDLLPEGKGQLKIAVAVWKPLNKPELVDYKIYEGTDVTDTVDHLIVDEQGYSNLWLMRPEKYNLIVQAKDVSSAVYAQAYRELGWAELMDVMEITVEVDLSREGTYHATLNQMDYQVQDVQVALSQFAMSQAGGQVEGWVYGDEEAVKNYMKNGLILVDRQKMQNLSNGCSWMDWDETKKGSFFFVTIRPISGELPEELYLAAPERVDYRWDETSYRYDETFEKPANVVDAFQVDFEKNIHLDMVIHK